MPYSDDIRNGVCHANINLDMWWDWLTQNGLEICIRRDGLGPDERLQHETLLNEYVEKKANDYIAFWIFGVTQNEGDFSPKSYPQDIWGYVAGHVQQFIKKHPTKYALERLSE